MITEQEKQLKELRLAKNTLRVSIVSAVRSWCQRARTFSSQDFNEDHISNVYLHVGYLNMLSCLEVNNKRS